MFARQKDRLTFLSEARREPRASISEEDARRSPLFLRSEEVHGLKTFVIKTGPGDRDEVYRAPALNGDWVKTVRRHENGNLRTTTEPVSIVLGDPDPSVFKGIDLPVDRSFHEQKEQMRQQKPRPE